MTRYKINYSNIFYENVTQIPSGVLVLRESFDLGKFVTSVRKAVDKLPMFGTHYKKHIIPALSYLETNPDRDYMPIDYEYFEKDDEDFVNETISKYAQRTAKYMFINLDAKYLFKFKILSFKNNVNCIFLTWEHTLCDGEAIMIFFNEILRDYYSLHKMSKVDYKMSNVYFFRIFFKDLNIFQKAFFFIRFTFGAFREALENSFHRFYFCPKGRLKQTDNYALEWFKIPVVQMKKVQEHFRKINQKGTYLTVNSLYYYAINKFRAEKKIKTKYIKISEVISLSRFLNTEERKYIGNFLAVIFPKIFVKPGDTIEDIYNKLYKVYDNEWHHRKSFISNIFFNTFLFNFVTRLILRSLLKYVIRSSIATDTLLTNMSRYRTPLEKEEDIMKGEFFGVIPNSYRFNLSLAVTRFRDHYTFAFSYNPNIINKHDLLKLRDIIVEKVNFISNK